MKLQVSREELLRKLGYRANPQPRLMYMVLEMIELLGGVVKPDLAFKKIPGEKALPPFLSGADLKYAGAATLGPTLEDKVNELFKEGRAAEAYILDTAGSLAMTKAGDILWDRIRKDASAKGFKRGLRRTPGCRGIDLETQRWVFEKLGDRNPGIHLTASCMMFPRKSLSFLARFGGKLKDSFSCKGCRQRAECTLRG